MKTNITHNPTEGQMTTLLELFALEPVIAVDIETSTTGPVGTPLEGWDKYGLSYNADITDVALFAPGVGSVTFSDYYSTPRSQAFVKTALSRSGLTITAFNALFDLRSLGGHGGWRVHRHSLVWDSMTMNTRLLLAGNGKHDSLLSVVTRYRLLHKPHMAEFLGGRSPEVLESWYRWMKGQRSQLDSLPAQLADLPQSHALWEFMGGYIPPTETGLLADAAARMLSEYVCWDTLLAYYVYEFQARAAKGVQKVNAVIPFEGYKLTKWPELEQLIPKWCNKARVSANQAIDGIKVGEGFLEGLLETYRGVMADVEPKIFAQKDRYVPYDDFDTVFSTIMWYSNILNVIRTNYPTAVHAAYNNPTNFRFWQKIRINREVLIAAMTYDSEGLDFDERECKEVWADWLLSLDPDTLTRSKLLKGAPFQPVKENGDYVHIPSYPVIDLTGWVQRSCFANTDIDPTYAQFLAQTKVNWLTYFWKYNPTALEVKRSGEGITPQMLIRKDAFAPYYLHVVCGMSPANSDDLLAVPGMVTQKFWEGFREEKHDALEYAIENHYLSYSAGALNFYLAQVGTESEQLQLYRSFIEAQARVIRAEEMYLHSLRDGRIHALMPASTTTGRDSCGLPNLQNISMVTFKGMLVGDPGFELLEADYSNAENVMGGLIAGDDAFVQATRSGDFHSEMRDKYWPKEVAALKEAGDKKGLKTLRSRSKTVTFSIPYGVGAKKLSRTLRSTPMEAQAIMDSRTAAFPRVSAKMKEVEDECNSRFNKGYHPAYISLWDSARCALYPYMDTRTKREKLALYTTWNYLQQGGVSILTHGAMVECADYLEDNGFKSKVVHNVHDSLVFMIHEDEYHTDLPMELIRIMCRQMPQEFLDRTIPAANFVAEFGPENWQKWGHRHNAEPLFGQHEFINQWGRHALPVEATEAPTWQGNLNEGWTLDAEIEAAHARAQGVNEVETDGDGLLLVQAADSAERWETLTQAVSVYQKQLTDLQAAIGTLEKSFVPQRLLYVDQDGTAVNAGLFGFVERMVALEAVEQRGHTLDNLTESREALTILMAKLQESVIIHRTLIDWGIAHGFTERQ